MRAEMIPDLLTPLAGSRWFMDVHGMSEIKNNGAHLSRNLLLWRFARRLHINHWDPKRGSFSHRHDALRSVSQWVFSNIHWTAKWSRLLMPSRAWPALSHQPTLGGSLLKYRLYHYSVMVKLTDQEMIAVGKIVCYSQFPRGGRHHNMGAHTWQHQSWSGRRGTEGKMWVGAFTVVSLGRNKQGGVSKFRTG